jgi:hypothetical protein
MACVRFVGLGNRTPRYPETSTASKIANVTALTSGQLPTSASSGVTAPVRTSEITPREQEHSEAWRDGLVDGSVGFQTVTRTCTAGKVLTRASSERGGAPEILRRRTKIDEEAARQLGASSDAHAHAQGPQAGLTIRVSGCSRHYVHATRCLGASCDRITGRHSRGLLPPLARIGAGSDCRRRCRGVEPLRHDVVGFGGAREVVQRHAWL